MKHLKKFFCSGFMGIGIGYSMSLLFSFFHGEYSPGVPSFLNQYDSVLNAVAIQTLVYLILGLVQAYASMIMENKNRSLLLNTILHFLVILLPLLGASYFLHWHRNLVSLILIALMVTFIYFGIWIVNYLHIKAQIEQINQKISKN
ncbi:DUF3021 domain-containing protein [Facklamia miroungae]|uniref:DUF3021 domain-containing protein n=1 Tax=Facklamia miroungae TaxID=120956 RepID=A0A1G7UZ91_9LACT|nr:DUF3021 domain-containing protein [Facklamia miroungae]NKZ30199.1 DUF3021 domain-containing protein [Facklamia miroungae]SDG52618.1 Protein of unknown function [Facklamia miroungae]